MITVIACRLKCQADIGYGTKCEPGKCVLAPSAVVEAPADLPEPACWRRHGYNYVRDSHPTGRQPSSEPYTPLYTAEQMRASVAAVHSAYCHSQQQFLDSEHHAARLREALAGLHKAARQVSTMGAQPGKQWTALTVACLKAESALAESATTGKEPGDA